MSEVLLLQAVIVLLVSVVEAFCSKGIIVNAGSASTSMLPGKDLSISSTDRQGSVYQLSQSLISLIIITEDAIY